MTTQTDDTPRLPPSSITLLDESTHQPGRLSFSDISVVLELPLSQIHIHAYTMTPKALIKTFSRADVKLYIPCLVA